MIKYLLELLPYVVGIVIGIVVPAIIIARQEISIEGPFGWSALTFTKRFPTMHWFSKVYRYISGQDKWATEYHLNSNLIWLFMYFLSFLYIPIFSRLAGYSNTPALIGTCVLAIASFVSLNWVEDFTWFMIHPYYGPERHTPEYVPWFTNYKAGIPVGYWLSMTAALGITLVGALLLQKAEIFIMWLMVTVLVVAVCFGIIRPWSRKTHREPLLKYWWKDISYVVIQRCPYPIEKQRPFTTISAHVIDSETMGELVYENKVKSLCVALGTRFIPPRIR
jgi:hypothetical protein